jgi:hypothetical protein
MILALCFYQQMPRLKFTKMENLVTQQTRDSRHYRNIILTNLEWITASSLDYQERVLKILLLSPTH